MSNELAVVDTSNYLALKGGGEVLAAMKENMPPGVGLRESDLTRVKIPAQGGRKWSVPTLGDDEVCDELVGIMVYQCVRGVLWGNDEPAEGTLPVLVTHDLKNAKVVCDYDDIPDDMRDVIDKHTNADGCIDWESLPWTQWGSGKRGVGKKAKEQRIIYLLREGDMLPLVIAIQPGSLKNWQQFMLKISKAGLPYWRVVVRLTLESDRNESGIAYSKVLPDVAGQLEPEVAKMVRDNLAFVIEGAAKSAF